MKDIVQLWDLPSELFEIHQISDGLINATFRIDFEVADSQLLQKINQNVFRDPNALMSNYEKLKVHLSRSEYPFEIPEWRTSKNGNYCEQFEGGIYRLGNYFDDVQTHHHVDNSEMAYSVGEAFGQFDKALLTMSGDHLSETISDFHHLEKYLKRLQETIISATKNRIKSSREILDKVDDYLSLLKKPFPKQRIIHNDAKISNLLFRGREILAIIDWDTTMAGHISWEFADLVRTSIINVPEDHNDIHDIELQLDHFKGVSAGFKSVIFDHLNDKERDSFYSGTMYIILEQAIRFLEDYLAGDRYYKCDYEDHNLVRARNQFHILHLLKTQKRDIRDCFRRA